MKLTIDTDAGVLSTETSGIIPLYSTEAFEIISREWVRIGWGCNYYFTLSWFGRPILQLPDDLVRLQEAVYDVQPDLILECGIYSGGSLLFHASLCEAMGKGRVIGVDKHIAPDTRTAIEQHRLAHRIEMIEGDSVAPETVAKVHSSVRCRANSAGDSRFASFEAARSGRARGVRAAGDAGVVHYRGRWGDARSDGRSRRGSELVLGQPGVGGPRVCGGSSGV